MKKRGRIYWGAWHTVVAMILVPFVVGGLVWFLTLGKDVAVLNPQGVIAAQQKELILFTLLLSGIVVLPVFLMLAVFAWRYRDTNPKATYTPDVEGNRGIEAIWWGVPVVIIGILSVVTWVSTHQLDPYKPLVSDVKALKVQVVALQWRWLFLYPEQHMATVNELIIPAGTPVNFEITADAPMSAFWIPSLGSQTYAMTGMSARLSLMADNPGTYRGTNTNINGTGYAKMDFKVSALKSREAFEKWARDYSGDAKHTHMDLDVYENLAKPTDNSSIKYYHLHDKNLYTKVINKFAHGGASQKEGHEH